MAKGLYVGTRNGVSTLTVTDFRWLIKKMDEIEPGSAAAMKKESKEVGRKMANAIKPAIPSRAPLSGMRPKVEPGRLTWGTGKPAKSALVKTPRMKKTSKAYRSIVSIWFGSPATVIAAVAGSSGKYLAKKAKTRMYPYSGAGFGGQRQHRITRAGSEKFVQNLNSRAAGKLSQSPKGKTTRYIWWAAEKAQPAVAREIDKILIKYAAKINAEVRK